MKRIVVFLLAVCIFNSLSSIFSIHIVNAEERAEQSQSNIISEGEIKDFINNYFDKKMKEYHVPGAAVVVVKDNKEVFKKGYGYSNLDPEAMVDPDETMFPAGSVSKLFTAAAIMQLYEKGKIDLDKDVNDYISPYKISNKYERDVTCRNLLTHSSGLDEESELDLACIDVNSIKSQEYYFDKHPLKVINEPDTICRYSNIGYNLLGYIVEKVSGVSYEDYVKENILKVLNMDNSNVRLKGNNFAKGYEYSDGRYNELPFSYQYTSGSSGIISTAKDMENFMIVNLDHGRFKESNIMKDETINLMHDKQFSNNDVFSGMGFGFIRSNRNNIEVIKHEGALSSGYTSTLFMIPKENLGIYVATNALTGLPFNFEEEFLSYFYPCDNSFDINNKNSYEDYSKYEGSYRSYDGIAKSNIMKMAVLFDDDTEIKDNKDGTLTLTEVSQDKEKITTKLVEEEKGVFLREDGKGRFVFKFDDDGNVTYAFNDVSINSFEKQKFYEKRQFIIPLALIVLIIYFINFVLSIISLIKRKVLKQHELEKVKGVKLIKSISLIVESFNIIGALGAVILTVKMCLTGEFNLAYGLYFCLSLLNISVVLTILNIAILIYYIVKKKGTLRSRIYYILLNASELVFIWILYSFNLLGYKLF